MGRPGGMQNLMGMAPGMTQGGNNMSAFSQAAGAMPGGQGPGMGTSGYTPGSMSGMGAPPIMGNGMGMPGMSGGMTGGATGVPGSMGGERPGMGQGFSPLGVSTSGAPPPNANQNLMGQRNRFTVGQQVPQGTQQMGQAQGPLGQMRQGMPEGGSQNLMGQKQGQLDQMRKGL